MESISSKLQFSESRRLANVQAPVIPIIGELAAQTPGTISLGQGVVFYPPPPAAFEQIEKFKSDPANHRYKLVAGISPLLEVLWNKLKAENKITPEGRDLIVTAGANLAFANALLAITDPGDEIILPRPCYFNHDMAIEMASCKTVLAPTDKNYQLDLEALKKLITSKTRAIVTISPNNPTGAVYQPEVLKAVNQLCAENGLFHICDEAYEYFLYDGATHLSPGSIPGSESHTISIYSLSKAYGFASWRIGYMVIPKQLSSAVKKVQDTLLICAPVVSQFAAIGALSAGRAYSQKFLSEIAEVREQFYQEISSLSDLVDSPRTNGAFYSLLRLKQKADPMQLAQELVRQHKVAVIPGSAFCAPQPALRVSFGALDRSLANEAILRLARGLKSLLVGK